MLTTPLPTAKELDNTTWFTCLATNDFFFFFFWVSTIFRTTNVKSFMDQLNPHFNMYKSSNTKFNLNENATTHYFNVKLRSGNKIGFGNISFLRTQSRKFGLGD